jgi:hypothetical protein
MILSLSLRVNNNAHLPREQRHDGFESSGSWLVPNAGA